MTGWGGGVGKIPGGSDGLVDIGRSVVVDDGDGVGVGVDALDHATGMAGVGAGIGADGGIGVADGGGVGGSVA